MGFHTSIKLFGSGKFKIQLVRGSKIEKLGKRV